MSSQSYSCWYWVLSGYLKTINLTIKTSQSYSCWYWVLSIEFYDSDGQFIFVSILFLLVLGSVKIPFFKSTIALIDLNPNLAGSGFCRLSPHVLTEVQLVTHLSLLELGS